MTYTVSEQHHSNDDRPCFAGHADFPSYRITVSPSCPIRLNNTASKIVAAEKMTHHGTKLPSKKISGLSTIMPKMVMTTTAPYFVFVDSFAEAGNHQRSEGQHLAGLGFAFADVLARVSHINFD